MYKRYHYSNDRFVSRYVDPYELIHSAMSLKWWATGKTDIHSSIVMNSNYIFLYVMPTTVLIEFMLFP